MIVCHYHAGARGNAARFPTALAIVPYREVVGKKPNQVKSMSADFARPSRAPASPQPHTTSAMTKSGTRGIVLVCAISQKSAISHSGRDIAHCRDIAASGAPSRHLATSHCLSRYRASVRYRTLFRDIAIYSRYRTATAISHRTATTHSFARYRVFSRVIALQTRYRATLAPSHPTAISRLFARYRAIFTT